MNFSTFLGFTFRAAAPIGVCATAQAESILALAPGQSLQDALDTVADEGTIELTAGTYNAPSGGWTIFPISVGTRKALPSARRLAPASS